VLCVVSQTVQDAVDRNQTNSCTDDVDASTAYKAKLSAVEARLKEVSVVRLLDC